MYKTDTDIATEFNNFTILGMTSYSDCSGRINVEFPEGGDHVGGGTTEVNTGYIIYDSGKIAFDDWFPDNVYHALCAYIVENK